MIKFFGYLLQNTYGYGGYFGPDAIAGKNGINMTTSPFGGVFYPVELAFELL